MIVLSCLTGCRNCLKGDSTRKGYILKDGTRNDFPNDSEYETMEYIEEWRSGQSSECPFCGSKNVEVLDIEVNNNALYNYDRLVEECKASRGNKVIFMISMDKVGSEIEVDLGGSNPIRKNFLEYCFEKMVEVIKRRPNTDFQAHHVGSFFICVSGTDDLFQRKFEIKMERYRSCGLSRDEILSKIKATASSNGVVLRSL